MSEHLVLPRLLQLDERRTVLCDREPEQYNRLREFELPGLDECFTLPEETLRVAGLLAENIVCILQALLSFAQLSVADRQVAAEDDPQSHRLIIDPVVDDMPRGSIFDDTFGETARAEVVSRLVLDLSRAAIALKNFLRMSASSSVPFEGITGSHPFSP